VSGSLLTAETIPVGSEIWVDDEEQVWMLADVIRQENTSLTVRRKATGEELEIDLVRTFMRGNFPAAAEDATGLGSFERPLILTTGFFIEKLRIVKE